MFVPGGETNGADEATQFVRNHSLRKALGKRSLSVIVPYLNWLEGVSFSEAFYIEILDTFIHETYHVFEGNDRLQKAQSPNFEEVTRINAEYMNYINDKNVQKLLMGYYLSIRELSINYLKNSLRGEMHFSKEQFVRGY